MFVLALVLSYIYYPNSFCFDHSTPPHHSNMAKPVTSSQHCFCVTRVVLFQWPTLSSPDQLIDETLMNLPSARHRHLHLCLWCPHFEKAACDATCLQSCQPEAALSWCRASVLRCHITNTLLLLLQRLSRPTISDPCKIRVMMLEHVLGQYSFITFNSVYGIEHKSSCFRQVFLDTCLNAVTLSFLSIKFYYTDIRQTPLYCSAQTVREWCLVWCDYNLFFLQPTQLNRWLLFTWRHFSTTPYFSVSP